MESTSSRELVTVVRFDEEAMGSDSEASRYSMAKESIDYSVEWRTDSVVSNMTLKRLAEI